MRTHIALLVALDSACPKLWSGFNYLKRLPMYIILQISSMVRNFALFRSIAWPKDHTNKNKKIISCGELHGRRHFVVFDRRSASDFLNSIFTATINSFVTKMIFKWNYDNYKYGFVLF